jgi:hypothetical protein
VASSKKIEDIAAYIDMAISQSAAPNKSGTVIQKRRSRDAIRYSFDHPVSFS